eukprot:CAMPEP_0174368100 /NCGR_PEP_ID=MMETSP0811_2-20130205/87806_1 /TAXON_ID=73025 ORGANISM="Eutreptiella gymnastica-like, Strain CCMP1594" /NCGR_SAMPLE_ID=MMETSP0811_2 /ASSEMBLY_ACC=CAM_ASM_000667 /LENGTH=74 /DNA_ID=CAMNT_0015511291 /DNA_START=234 /DNA_END=458 /DNA_ORIENTATION=-
MGDVPNRFPRRNFIKITSEHEDTVWAVQRVLVHHRMKLLNGSSAHAMLQGPIRPPAAAYGLQHPMSIEGGHMVM